LLPCQQGDKALKRQIPFNFADFCSVTMRISKKRNNRNKR